MNILILKTILEGLGLGALLILVCVAGIRKGAVGMVYLYSPEVQARCVEPGLTSPGRIKRNALFFKQLCIPGYICLCACLHLRSKRCKRLPFRILAVARDSVHHEFDRPFSRGWFLGRTYESLADPRHRGSDAIYHRERQVQKVALWHGRSGRGRGSTFRDHAAVYSLRGESDAV